MVSERIHDAGRNRFYLRTITSLVVEIILISLAMSVPKGGGGSWTFWGFPSPHTQRKTESWQMSQDNPTKLFFPSDNGMFSKDGVIRKGTRNPTPLEGMSVGVKPVFSDSLLDFGQHRLVNKRRYDPFGTGR